MKILLHPAYLPNIAHYAALVNADNYIFEACDNFQKQTFRNRAFIYGANGILKLNIPVRHSQNNRQLYKDVKIAYDTNWQLQHQRSIETAYRASPFFEFYQDELLSLYNKKETFLYDLNKLCHEKICECLDIPFKYEATKNYLKNSAEITDARFLINAKSNVDYDIDQYNQVFIEKHGFKSNLSVIDLVCNEGPSSLSYLKRQNLLSNRF